MRRAIERLAFGVILALLLIWCVIVATAPGFVDREPVAAGYSRFGR